MDSPSGELRREHRIIERVLKVLTVLVTKHEAGQPFDAAALGRCVEFFRLFADACHHAKEEDLLFPVLEMRGMPRDGGPIGVMLYEHTIARRLTAGMGDALAAYAAGDESATKKFVALAHDYIQLLTQHIYKEDNILFRMGDQVMSPADQQSLCGKFCEVGCRSFGGKQREDLERIADDLERQLAAA